MMPLLTTELAQAIEEILSGERPCEATKDEDHGNPAIWWAIPSCGCGIYAYCSTHKLNVIEMLDRRSTLECRHCAAAITVRWKPITR